MGARNQVGIGLSYRPISICSLATQFQTRFLESASHPIAGLKFSTQHATNDILGKDRCIPNDGYQMYEYSFIINSAFHIHYVYCMEYMQSTPCTSTLYKSAKKGKNHLCILHISDIFRILNNSGKNVQERNRRGTGL